MKKKTLTLVALLCTFVLGAWAEDSQPAQFKYIERSWSDSQVKVVDTEKTITEGYTILTGAKDPDDWELLGSKDDYNDHYYVVVGGTNVTYKTLNVYGKAHLILCDGATLTCTGGILVERNNNNAHLFIYGQKNDTGKLIVTNSYDDAAGIGSSNGRNWGTISIHGGNLDITGGKRAAGIGGGGLDGKYGAYEGVTSIYGGHIKAQGGKSGAGIGNGARSGNGGQMYFYGGEITATGGETAAGVGGGGSHVPLFSENKAGGLCGSIYVYAAKLTAQGGEKGAGIGTGTQIDNDYVFKGELYVYHAGAVVTATGGKYGAGIGGGYMSDGIKTYINGGTVTAKGGEDAAGIGSGEYQDININYGNRGGGETHISGGTVRAEGTGYGAGIGGGELGLGGNTYITGGTVIAIVGDDCTGRNDKKGSAIGGGKGISNKDDDFSARVLEIGANMMVTGGDAENNNDGVFSSDLRVPACRWRNFVKIEICPHTAQNNHTTAEDITYSIVDNSYHDRYCRYCKTVIREDHAAGECPCGKTGYSFTTYVPSSSTGGSGYQLKQTYRVNANNEFYLPDCDVVPTGYKFLGWEMNPDPEDADKWAAVKGGGGGEDNKIAAGTSVKTLEGMDNAKFYARYLYDFKAAWQWNADCTMCTLILSCDAWTNSNFQVVFTQNDAIVREYLTDCVEYSISYTYNDDVNGYKYQFSTQKRVPYELTLQDNADNSAAIAAAATICTTYNAKYDVTLSGRTLYRDGKWNTLCLPFDVNVGSGPLSGDNVEAMVLRSSDSGLSGTTLTLNFDDATSIPAGTPFIIKWGTKESHPDTDLTDPEFTGVTVSTATNDVNFDSGAFKGTYAKQEYTTENQNILLLGDDNNLYYPQPSGGSNPSIGAFRAYFELNSGASARAFVLNFGESETTGILSTTNLTNFTNSDAWYDLSGCRLNAKPTAKGLYINNGRKVVIK